MYFCDHCKQLCNRTINVFITLNLCPKCYEKWQYGELGNNKEEKKDVVTGEKVNEINNN